MGDFLYNPCTSEVRIYFISYWVQWHWCRCGSAMTGFLFLPKRFSPRTAKIAPDSLIWVSLEFYHQCKASSSTGISGGPFISIGDFVLPQENIIKGSSPGICTLPHPHQLLASSATSSSLLHFTRSVLSAAPSNTRVFAIHSYHQFRQRPPCGDGRAMGDPESTKCWPLLFGWDINLESQAV